MPETRSYDIVLFGATGFTGGLTAEYLARDAPAECRWALAGRNQSKLSALRDRLAGINPACAELPLLHADASDPDSLRAVATDARVVATTVGPYLEHGEPLVAACAEAGTDYLDLTGEPMFVDLMYLRHHATARESGARERRAADPLLRNGLDPVRPRRALHGGAAARRRAVDRGGLRACRRHVLRRHVPVGDRRHVPDPGGGPGRQGAARR